MPIGRQARICPTGVIALRIFFATPKKFSFGAAAADATFHYFRPALRTFHANLLWRFFRQLLSILTIRKTAAGNEFSKTAVFNNHWLSAFIANLVSGFVFK